MKQKFTQAKLKKLLHYDSETGFFTWKISIGKIKKDSLVNCKDLNGYVKIGINKKGYLAHRLAWLYVYGYFPEHDIDHVDRNPMNNRIKNLREISHTCNIRNTGNYSHNTSGVKGVGWVKRTKKYRAEIMVKGKSYHLGYYKSFDNAICARLAAEQCFDWDGCDSSSPAYQYVRKQVVSNVKR